MPPFWAVLFLWATRRLLNINSGYFKIKLYAAFASIDQKRNTAIEIHFKKLNNLQHNVSSCFLKIIYISMG
jgi:hypothetical protein